MQKHTFIIAEAGVNHNGSLDLAYQLVDAAKEAGADCVKFQTYITENDTSRFCEKAQYQKTENEENQFEMLKKLELSFADFRELKQYCEKQGIMFLSTPFDIESAKFLDSIQMPLWKVASSEIENFQLLKYMGETHKEVLLSTGMCTMEEIEQAVHTLKRFGSEEIHVLQKYSARRLCRSFVAFMLSQSCSPVKRAGTYFVHICRKCCAISRKYR